MPKEEKLPCLVANKSAFEVRFGSFLHFFVLIEDSIICPFEKKSDIKN